MRHRHRHARSVGALFCLLLGTSPGVRAADMEVPFAGFLPITVLGSTPLVEADLSRDQVVETSRVLNSADIDRTGIPTLTGALLENVPSMTINDTEGNGFQPDILFRGFTASPVAGTAQGLVAPPAPERP